MKIHPIHMTPAERQSDDVHETRAAIEQNTATISEMARAIGNLKLTDLAVSLVTIAQNLLENKQKLEEVKSATLANTIVLKQVVKAIKDIPQTDMRGTNALLSELIKESKKPLKTTLKIT